MPKVHGAEAQPVRRFGEQAVVIYDANGVPRSIGDLLSQSAYTTRTGEVTASPAANTLLARLKDIVTELDARIPASLSNPLQVELEQITAAALQKDNQTSAIMTLATANIDQIAPSAVPAWAKYLWAWCASAFKVAVDEATTAAIGVDVPANNPVLWPIKTVAGGDGFVHAQSSTTLAQLYTAYLANAG